MFTKLIAGGVMAMAAAALTASSLAPSSAGVLAGDICVGENVSGEVNVSSGPFCEPFPYGVNCQTTLLGMPPTIDTKTYVCVPRP